MLAWFLYGAMGVAGSVVVVLGFRAWSDSREVDQLAAQLDRDRLARDQRS